MKNFVKAIDKEGDRFAFLQEKFLRIIMEKLKAGLSDLPLIRTHEGPNVWRNIEWSWIVRLLLVTNFQGKPPKFGIQEGNWRATEDFPPTLENRPSVTFVPKELWKFEWRAGWVLSPRHLHYGRALPRAVGCKLSRWLLLVLETGCVTAEHGRKSLSSMNSFCVFFSLLWDFEYISPIFTIV